MVSTLKLQSVDFLRAILSIVNTCTLYKLAFSKTNYSHDHFSKLSLFWMR